MLSKVGHILFLVLKAAARQNQGKLARFFWTRKTCPTLVFNLLNFPFYTINLFWCVVITGVFLFHNGSGIWQINSRKQNVWKVIMIRVSVFGMRSFFESSQLTAFNWCPLSYSMLASKAFSALLARIMEYGYCNEENILHKMQINYLMSKFLLSFYFSKMKIIY